MSSKILVWLSPGNCLYFLQACAFLSKVNVGRLS
uniref:Uncharacterized protein n=1 Tax=Rhizophora mucronata TaxID=61149 RepID=A0A2P2JRM4_RHIMU